MLEKKSFNFRMWCRKLIYFLISEIHKLTHPWLRHDIDTISVLPTFVRGIPTQRVSNEFGRWCCLCWYLQRAVEQMFGLPLIWDAMMLMWHHCNVCDNFTYLKNDSSISESLRKLIRASDHFCAASKNMSSTSLTCVARLESLRIRVRLLLMSAMYLFSLMVARSAFVRQYSTWGSLVWKREWDRGSREDSIMTSRHGQICITDPLWGDSLHKGPVMQSVGVSFLLIWMNCCTNSQILSTEGLNTRNVVISRRAIEWFHMKPLAKKKRWATIRIARHVNLAFELKNVTQKITTIRPD